jgi:hypothetical protein
VKLGRYLYALIAAVPLMYLAHISLENVLAQEAMHIKLSIVHSPGFNS